MKIQDHILVGEGDDAVSFVDTKNYSNSVAPLYLIMHYTAGITADSAISWFQDPKAEASAHLVIDRNGEITQMVPFNRRAWHAGESRWGKLESMNQYSIGIELVNAGKLRRNPSGEWVNWKGKVIPSDDVTVAIHKNEKSEAGWQEYTEAQVEAALRVGTLLHSVYDFTDVLGHDDVSPERKVDPGPLFPLEGFRSRILGRA